MTPLEPMISHLWSIKLGDDWGSTQLFSMTAVAPFAKSTRVIYMSAVGVPWPVKTPSLRRQNTRSGFAPTSQQVVSRAWLPRKSMTDDSPAHGNILVGT